MAPQGPYGKLWITPNGEIYRALTPQQKTDTLSKVAHNGYRNHKHYAASRKLGFSLTFEQWWKFWQDSGHFKERGPLPHQYCMARGTPKRPDVGPYKLGNVRIITNKQNRAEQGMEYLIGNKHALGSKHTEEWKRAQSERLLGNTNAAGRKWPKEERARISEAMKEVWRLRKEELQELRRRKYGPSGHP